MVSYQNHRADMVPVAGLEPARINRRILSAMRLPFRHTGERTYYNTDYLMLARAFRKFSNRV